jgi:hypothetical protein
MAIPKPVLKDANKNVLKEIPANDHRGVNIHINPVGFPLGTIVRGHFNTSELTNWSEEAPVTEIGKDIVFHVDYPLYSSNAGKTATVKCTIKDAPGSESIQLPIVPGTKATAHPAAKPVKA